jgi:hypothetical protein
MGKRAAWISGVAAAAVLAVGLLLSRELAVRYQAARLERDLDRFLEGLVRPEGTVDREAARRVVASGRLRGKVLLETYLEQVAGLDGNFQKVLQQHRQVYQQTSFTIGPGGGLLVIGIWGEEGQGLLKRPFFAALNAPDPVLVRLRAIQDLLADEGFRCADVSRYPGAEFSFQRLAALPAGTSLISTNRAPESPYCFIRWPERAGNQR